jgi:hypothetical protein
VIAHLDVRRQVLRQQAVLESKVGVLLKAFPA